MNTPPSIGETLLVNYGHLLNGHMLYRDDLVNILDRRGDTYKLQLICVGGMPVIQSKLDLAYFDSFQSNLEKDRAIADESMIITDARAAELTFRSDLTTKGIGYWRSDKDLAADTYYAKGVILPWPEAFVDPSWNPVERLAVASYLEGASSVASYRGFSSCRICGKVPLGSQDLGDRKYTWPSGFSHYIREHNVKPPQEFIDHVLANV